MIDATVYFEHFLAWKKRTPNRTDNSMPERYFEAYTAMEPDILQHDADMGNPAALEELGERYLFGLDPFGRDVAQAEALFREAAEAGHPDAWQMLAELYRTDQFGRRDEAHYYELLPKAAEAGSWRAMYQLAGALYRGVGYEQDPAAALQWSLNCYNMTGSLIDTYLHRTCSKNFDEYFSNVYDTFVASLCAAAKQMIDGAGCDADPARAGALASEAQAFHRECFREDHPKFASLISYCQRKCSENQ